MSLALKQSKANVGANSGGAFMSRSQFQGDPGLFGFLGKAAGFLGKTVLKATGLVGAGAAGAGAAGAIDRVRTPSITRQPFQQLPQQRPPIRIGGVGIDPSAAFPGGRPLFTREQQNGTKLACPSGFHPNKSSYFLKDGTFVAEGSRCVKNRRKNPLNPRAASRAISRLESAKKATKRLDRVSIKCKRCGRARCTC